MCGSVRLHRHLNTVRTLILKGSPSSDSSDTVDKKPNTRLLTLDAHYTITLAVVTCTGASHGHCTVYSGICLTTFTSRGSARLHSPFCDQLLLSMLSADNRRAQFLCTIWLLCWYSVGVIVVIWFYYYLSKSA